MLKYARVRRLAGAGLAMWLALGPRVAAADGAVWTRWQSVKGVFDAGGPRTDAAAAQPLIPPGLVDFAGEWGVAIAVLAITAAFAAAVVIMALRRRPR